MTTEEDTAMNDMRLVCPLVELARPERYWIAVRGDVPFLTDPDVEDGHQRHADRDEIRWHLIADVLGQVSEALKVGSYTASELEHVVEIPTTTPGDGLTPTEMDILDSWFDYGEAPRFDSWGEALTNGRHRLWAIWSRIPSATLPIRSDLLDYLDDVGDQGEAFAASIRTSAEEGLTVLTPQLQQRSPLYVDALRAATSAGVES